MCVEMNRGELEGKLKPKEHRHPESDKLFRSEVFYLYITQKTIRLGSSLKVVILKGTSENVLENVTQNLKNKS